jgi:hypothetical protein
VPRDLGERERARRYALHLVSPVVEDDVVLRRLQHVRRDRARVLLHLEGRSQDGRAADRQAPAPAGPVAHGRVGRVTVAYHDLVEGDAQVVRDDLGEGRLVTLAVRRAP